MTKKIACWLCCLLFFGTGWGQQESGKSQPAKNNADTAAIQVIDVLFATNDDCDLYINGEAKGSVLKTDFRYLKLAPGDYRYRVKSKTTGDELSDVFTVSEEGTNEVFLDMLYVIDEKAAERTRLQNAGFPLDTATQNKNFAGTKARRTVLTKEEAQKETVNFLLSNAVLIKGGSFTMGNNRAPARDEAEHSVTLSPFYFSKFEVTQHQWQSIMGYNPSANKGCETCPVENVSWEDAVRFVRRLDSLSNRKFRLPTEAEWEYVARTGGKDEIDKAGGQEAYIKKTAWYFSNAQSKPHPVGRREPNAAGIYDMTGNVSEWCSDWYSPGFYKVERSRLNPAGPVTGKEKVIRGGNFKDYVGDHFRPSFRNKRTPASKSNEVGFRVVLSLSE
ncbi:formylglycine-generating enzyme family protein [Flavisolibacter ginsenosidimutans]|uniref:Formylglycine-generating enzyme family protein n=1 Tax=Flavisolibacter ginsenosidimutans TaxID=661481 RepID=A0A5B8UIW1_9BACT|nr:SUMF1/EgtB/PvdO family nonheme iron enzyme [Flavisolibacter ginsenosidimutans]QEC56099.1 formylglycine-generating enzyme family protein [Flavisolibacter ginsenosidimutans]